MMHDFQSFKKYIKAFIWCLLVFFPLSIYSAAPAASLLVILFNSFEEKYRLKFFPITPSKISSNLIIYNKF